MTPGAEHRPPQVSVEEFEELERHAPSGLPAP